MDQLPEWYLEPVYRPELKRSLVSHFARELGTFPTMDLALIVALETWFEGRVPTQYVAGALARSRGESEAEANRYLDEVYEMVAKWKLSNTVQEYLNELQTLQGTDAWSIWRIHEDLLLKES